MFAEALSPELMGIHVMGGISIYLTFGFFLASFAWYFLDEKNKLPNNNVFRLLIFTVMMTVGVIPVFIVFIGHGLVWFIKFAYYYEYFDWIFV